ncbi:DNA replication initiation factor cdc45, partial [Irineochytrium annulatum]
MQIIFLDDGEADDLKEVQEAFQKTEVKYFADTAYFNLSAQFVESDDEDGSGPDGPAAEEDEEEEDGEDEDSDDADDPDGDGSPLKRKKKRRKDPVDDINAKRRKATDKRNQLRDARRVVVDYYSGGSYTGTSVASLFYTMATQMGRSSGDMLWWSIIGVTDQYLHERIDYRKYKGEAEVLGRETSRFELLANGGAVAGASGYGYGDDEDDDADDDDDPDRDPLRDRSRRIEPVKAPRYKPQRAKQKRKGGG